MEDVSGVSFGGLPKMQPMNANYDRWKIVSL